jgi:hypothetical protein
MTEYDDYMFPSIGTLSGKIYDDTSFFSKNMLFGRFSDESKIATVLTPAYEEYLDAYIDLINNTSPDYSEEKQLYVKSRQVSNVPADSSSTLAEIINVLVYNYDSFRPHMTRTVQSKTLQLACSMLTLERSGVKVLCMTFSLH